MMEIMPQFNLWRKRDNGAIENTFFRPGESADR